MQIDIDFDVFKALTAMRESESDTYNSVIRRLLELPPAQMLLRDLVNMGTNSQLRRITPETAEMQLGIWFGQKHFPDQTKFRATYKGRTYLAEIISGKWVGEDGIVRRSPSDAASAISGTNVNGWRFWHAQIPPSQDWHRLDEYR